MSVAVSMSKEEADAVSEILSGFVLIVRPTCFQFWNEDLRVSLFISKKPDQLFEELVALSYEPADSSDRWKTLIKPDAESVRTFLSFLRYDHFLRRPHES